MAKSKHWLLGSIITRNNAVVLKDSSANLLKTKNKHHGLFLLLTANEELEKAIWCILVHYDFIKAEQIRTVFKLHEHKIFLFHFIYNFLNFKNGEIHLNKKPLKNFNLVSYARKRNPSINKYTKLRESCLYVEDSKHGWKFPRNELLRIKHFSKIVRRYQDTFVGLWQFLHIIGDWDFTESSADNFKIFPRRFKKMDRGYQFLFDDTGDIKQRKNPLSKIPYTKNDLNEISG